MGLDCCRVEKPEHGSWRQGKSLSDGRFGLGKYKYVQLQAMMVVWLTSQQHIAELLVAAQVPDG